MIYDSFVCELVTKAIQSHSKVKNTDLSRNKGLEFDFTVRSIEPRVHLQVQLFEVKRYLSKNQQGHSINKH